MQQTPLVRFLQFSWVAGMATMVYQLTLNLWLNAVDYDCYTLEGQLDSCRKYPTPPRNDDVYFHGRDMSVVEAEALLAERTQRRAQLHHYSPAHRLFKALGAE